MAGILKFYNLTGGLNSIQGIGTLNQSVNRTESPDMVNVEYYKLSGIKSMEGNIKFSETVFEAPVTLGYEYILGSNKYMVVTTQDGKVWIYNRLDDTFEEIYKFTNGSSRHSIISFNNGIVVSNGIDDLVFYQKGRHTLLTGSVSGSSGSTTLTGIGSKFTEELHKGDYISINDVEGTFKIVEIASDTSLTIDRELEDIVTDELYYLGELSELDAVYRNEDDPNVQKPVRGLAMMSYQGRIFVGSNDGILYYSEIGLPHGWDLKYGAGAIPEFYNDNSDFTALATWEKYLVICKRESSYLLNGTDSDDANWSIEPFSDYTCDSQQSYVNCNNGFYVFSRKAGGIYPMLQRTIYNVQYQGLDSSTKIRDSFAYLDTSRYDYIFPVYHPRKKYIMFYMPMLTGKGSNDCFIFDVNTKTWLHRKVTQEVTIAFKFNDEVYIGTKDGKIFKEFQGLTFDTQPIEFYWKSPWFYYGQGTDGLSTREFRIKFSEESINRFKIRNRRDGRDDYKERNISNNLDAFTGLVWDAEDETLTDTVWDEDSWVVTRHIVKRFPLPNQYFNEMQIELYGNSIDEGMSIYGFEIDGVQLEEVPWR